jgi:mRNA interferase MazF
MVKRFDIYWVRLDPTLGSEIKKTRPAVIVSSDEDIDQLSTVIIAPLTSTIKSLSSRIECLFQGRAGSIVLDQLRAVDKIRLIKKMGSLDAKYQKLVLNTLQKMFG